MKLITRSLSLIALGTIVAAPAFANTVIEIETNGTAINNTIATAQSINTLDFTLNVNPNVFGNLPTATILGAGGNSDVDFYSFQANAGSASFDIDNSPFTFDTILSLFDSTGTLLAYNDDSVGDLGTDSGLDSFLGEYTLPTEGTYYITVAQFANFPTQAFSATTTNLVRPDGMYGGQSVSGVLVGDSSFVVSGEQAGSPYTLNISLGNPGAAVPEPGSVALLVGMASVGGIILRRRKK